MYNILLNVRPTWHKYLTRNSRTMMLLTFLRLLLYFNALTIFMLWILIINIPWCFCGLSSIMKSNSNVSLYSLFPLLIYVTWFRISGIPVVPLTFPCSFCSQYLNALISWTGTCARHKLKKMRDHKIFTYKLLILSFQHLSFPSPPKTFLCAHARLLNLIKCRAMFRLANHFVNWFFSILVAPR